MSKHDLNTKKWLYSFKVPRTYTKSIKEEKTDEEGKKMTITKEEDVTEDVEIFLKRPSRKLLMSAIFFTQLKYLKASKLGFLLAP